MSMTDPVPKALDFNVLLSEIESGSSGSIANVIRKLREHEVAAYNAGVGGPTGELVATFIAALDARANERNVEIEKTCAYHYQSFVEATQELLRIQNDAIIMQNNIGALNGKMESAVDQFNTSCTDLANCKLTVEHIDQCIQALQRTLPILDHYSRVEQSIRDGRFYHALRTLEDLEHQHLDEIKPFAFSEIMIRRIPKMRAEIKNSSLAELTDFLERIRKHSVRLGAVAMHETAQATGMDSENLIGPVTAKLSAVTSTVSDGPVPDSSAQAPNTDTSRSSEANGHSPAKLAELDTELDELISVAAGQGDREPRPANKLPPNERNLVRLRTEDLVDFGPVYRCLHIHSVLHERAEFERHYCAQRRKQCQLSLSLTPNQQANLRNYGEFFGSICGFFVVDDYLRHTLPGSSAFYQTYLDELWGSTVERLVEFARSNAGACHSAEDLIRLKDYSILFSRTMLSLGFPTAGLAEMITWIQRRYQRLLAGQWRQKFEKFIHDDSFSPIRIVNKSDLAQFLSLYPPANTAEFASLPFPRQLCYSWMVPRIYKAIQEYVDLCRRFCAHVDLACSELEDTINRATNALFVDCLNVVLTSNVRQSERMLPRLIQFCTNLEELETACGHLDAYLQQIAPSGHEEAFQDQPNGNVVNGNGNSTNETDSVCLSTGANPPRSRLQGASLLKDIRALVESLIYGHLNDCVDEFISLINYSQTNEAADSVSLSNGSVQNNLKPNEHIVDLTNWLSTTFQALANIPPKVAQTACISVCKHIARSLYDLLLSPQVTELSELCIMQISKDLTQCEAFIRTQPVPGLDRNMLSLIFADLRQLLDLFLRDDWSLYFESRNKTTGNPYDRVQPSVAIKLLERVRDTEKKRAGFLSAIRKEERGRRKKLDDVIRQLRELNVAPHP
ncbi:Exocyst complex component [Fasciola hepatica]|uniref:Exocyst complex component n=1 Tax=Fasciola hepatica TaxID=6192 RepID=A0A4E0R5I1_FASHE|nr:Exocyst complex component [Fasciola hepatica]